MISEEDKEKVRQATDFVQLVSETVELRQRLDGRLQTFVYEPQAFVFGLRGELRMVHEAVPPSVGRGE